MGLPTISKNTSVVTGRRAQVKELEQKHMKLFKLENLEKLPKFIPKMAYLPKTGDERVISFFPSEIMGGQDIYTEFVSRELVPEDSERRLWKWQFNPEYDTEYAKTEKHPATGHQQYLIPVAELIDVAELHLGVKEAPEPPKEEERQLELKMPTEGDLEDAPLSEMTLRDKIALDYKLPVSNKQWVNKIIIDNFKQN